MSTQNKKPRQDGLAIESIMKSIEKLLENLENNETPLDQSLHAFEEGIKLIRKAQKTLSEAEQRVHLLLEKDGEPVVADPTFDEESR